MCNVLKVKVIKLKLNDQLSSLSTKWLLRHGSSTSFMIIYQHDATACTVFVHKGDLVHTEG